MTLRKCIPPGTNDVARLSSSSLVSESERLYAGSPNRDQLVDLMRIHDWDHIEDPSFDIFDFVSLVRSSIDADGDSCGSRTVLPPPALPDRRTLCLDMDDTLTFMTFQRVSDEISGDLREYDTIVTAQENPNDWGMVYFRPYLRTFLEAVSKIYEVVVLTAACSEYADQILDAIDPEGRLIHHRLYRESCQECTPNPEAPDAKVYIKDLRVLGRPLNRVILIDNSLLCFAYQLDNGIVCNPYKGSFDDRELLSLLQVLMSLNSYPVEVDVRKFFGRMYGLGDIINEYRKLGGRAGIRRNPKSRENLINEPSSYSNRLIDLNEPDFFSPIKSKSSLTPSGKPTPNTRYPRSGIRTSDRHLFTPELENENHPETHQTLAAPPIFINTILPRFESSQTPIESLFESIIQKKSHNIYRG